VWGPPFENPDPQGESSSRGSATQRGALSYTSTRNQPLHPESVPPGGALTSVGENHHRVIESPSIVQLARNRLS